MAMREITGAAGMSEFISGYHGDCGECAELTFLHVLNPAAYPLDAAHLSQIVGREVGDREASANGAEPLAAIARDLGELHISYALTPYAEPFHGDWLGALNQHGGVVPILFEVARGGNLPGDEPGLCYHFITALAWDAELQEGIFADGDNPGHFVRYSAAQLAASQICGMIVSETTPPQPEPAPAPNPAPTGYKAYTVVSGDSLTEIVSKLHLAYGWHTVYQQNMAAIEAAARAHGHPNSEGGALIFPGEVLHYQA